MSLTDTSSPDADIFVAALALAPEARGRLAAELLQSLDDLPPSQQRSPQDWDAEINRRVESGLSGEAASVSYDDAVAALRAAGRGE